MARTHIAAPQFKTDVAEAPQQPSVNLNPGADKGVDAAPEIPVHQPGDIGASAFMEQLLTIQVHGRHDTPALDGMMLNFNGEDCWVEFGKPIRIKRKFVGILASMRETTFTQPKRNPYAVEAGNQLIPRTHMVCPFSVQHDPHPQGGEWLHREMTARTHIGHGLR